MSKKRGGIETEASAEPAAPKRRGRPKSTADGPEGQRAFHPGLGGMAGLGREARRSQPAQSRGRDRSGVADLREARGVLRTGPEALKAPLVRSDPTYEG